jgi:hypothetical protein
MNQWMQQYGNTAQGQQLLNQWKTTYGNNPFAQAYLGGQAPRATLVSTPGMTAQAPPVDRLGMLGDEPLVNQIVTPRAQPAVAGTSSWGTPDWMAYRAAVSQPDVFGAGGAFDVSRGNQGAVVGQPLTGDQSSQPVSTESELRGADTSALGASGAGEPQSRYNLAWNPNVTNVGGFTGAGGTVAGGFSPASGTSGFFGGLGQQGAANQQGYQAGLTEADPFGAGGTYDVTAGGGGGAMGGGQSPMQNLGFGVANVLSKFGDVVAKANAPVSVNPSTWAGPIPQPASFVWPTLSPQNPASYALPQGA